MGARGVLNVQLTIYTCIAAGDALDVEEHPLITLTKVPPMYVGFRGAFTLNFADLCFVAPAGVFGERFRGHGPAHFRAGSQSNSLAWVPFKKGKRSSLRMLRCPPSRASLGRSRSEPTPLRCSRRRKVNVAQLMRPPTQICSVFFSPTRLFTTTYDYAGSQTSVGVSLLAAYRCRRPRKRTCERSDEKLRTGRPFAPAQPLRPLPKAAETPPVTLGPSRPATRAPRTRTFLTSRALLLSQAGPFAIVP